MIINQTFIKMEQRVISIPPNGYQLHINNKFLPPYDTDPLNFKVPDLFNFNAPNQMDRPIRLFVHNVLFRNYIPTIRAQINDSFTYVIDGITFIDYFAPGNYNINNLITSITTALNAHGLGVFTVTFNSDQLLMTITPAGGHTFYIPDPSVVNSVYNVKQYNAYYRFLEMIGMLKNTNTTYTNASPCTGLYPVNLLTTDFMKINIDNQNCQIINTNPSNPQTIATIPVGTAAYGDLITYSPSLPVALDFDPVNMSSLRISCTDQSGAAIRGVPIIATLEIHLMVIPLE
jgi:hypothetical protein